jgi:hypothetical protein
LGNVDWGESAYNVNADNLLILCADMMQHKRLRAPTPQGIFSWIQWAHNLIRNWPLPELAQMGFGAQPLFQFMAPNYMHLIAMPMLQLPQAMHSPLIELCGCAPSRQSLHPIRIADFTTLRKKSISPKLLAHTHTHKLTMIKAAHEFNG